LLSHRSRITLRQRGRIKTLIRRAPDRFCIGELVTVHSPPAGDVLCQAFFRNPPQFLLDVL
jgi:hypothetical protein